MSGCISPESLGGYRRNMYSIKEMESIEVKTGNALLPLVHIMQDKDFKSCQLCGIPDNELQEFLLEFERKN